MKIILIGLIIALVGFWIRYLYRYFKLGGTLDRQTGGYPYYGKKP